MKNFFLSVYLIVTFMWCWVIVEKLVFPFAVETGSSAYKYAASWTETKPSPNPYRRSSETVSNADIQRELRDLEQDNQDLARQVQSLRWEVQRSNY